MKKELLKKFLMEKCSEEEFKELLQWIRNESLTPSGRAMMEEIWREYEPETAPQKQKYDQILDRIHHRINLHVNSQLYPTRHELKKSFKEQLIPILTRAAAVLLLPVLLLLVYTTLRNNPRHMVSNLNDVEVVSPLSSKTYIELGDGSKVWLNNGSKLKYPSRFNGKNRKVFLTGEAYFDVASNKKIPFIVGTENIDIKVTGTAFNVMAYPDDPVIETALVEGEVVLYKRGSSKSFKIMAPDEVLKYNTYQHTYTVDSGNVGKHISWKDGMLTFKNDAIEQVAQKLARWYNVDVSFSDIKAKEFTYTATFADESLQQVLELMQLATPITYELIPSRKLPDGSYSRRTVLIGTKRN
ncbi:MAG: FecR family protein [Prolixibacteraceae bacterium]